MEPAELCGLSIRDGVFHAAGRRLHGQFGAWRCAAGPWRAAQLRADLDTDFQLALLMLNPAVIAWIQSEIKGGLMLQPTRLLESAYVGKDFRFPSDYLNFLESYNPDDDDVWWFIGGNDDSDPDACCRILAEQFPYRRLVPFARLVGYDDIICFDGESKDGNPQVLMIHWFTSPGWELRGTWPTFSAWHVDSRIISD